MFIAEAGSKRQASVANQAAVVLIRTFMHLLPIDEPRTAAVHDAVGATMRRLALATLQPKSNTPTLSNAR